MLQQELENIRVILRDNDYPESIIDREFSTNWLGSNLFQNLALTNVLYISNCPGQAIFLLNFETKLDLLLSVVSEQLNHYSFSQAEKSFHP